MFFASDSCSDGDELPLAATGLLDMITIVLAWKRKPTESKFKRLMGGRKHIVRDLIDRRTSWRIRLMGLPLHAKHP